METCKCDVVVLLDDDTFPQKVGWEAGWVSLAEKFGHINAAFPDMILENPGHACTVASPGLTRKLAGACIAFSRPAWNYVGYMDSRFGKFGHEHTEYTNRFVRSGFGGIVRSTDLGDQTFYLVYDGDLAVSPADSNGTPELIKENQVILDSLNRAAHLEGVYRLPWADVAQQSVFLDEIFYKSRCIPPSERKVGPIRFGGFSDAAYLAKNPDVQSAGFSGWDHFFTFGLIEGRSF